jgi:V-type H+-transporting ATPase proteolipid subunit
MSDTTDVSGPASFFGFIGVACALVFANLGAAYGTAKSGVGISSMGVLKPDLIIKSIIPVVMAGILGIYGLIVSVILIPKVKNDNTYNYYFGFKHLASGLCCGLSSLVKFNRFNILGCRNCYRNCWRCWS